MIPGLLYQSSTESIIEFKPSCRAIRWGRKLNTLSFPYLIFIVSHAPNFNGLRLFYRKSPLQCMSDNVYDPTLPNIWMPHNMVCMGISYQGTNKDRICQEAIEEFWFTPFSYDNATSYYYDRSKLKIKKWAEETKKNREYWKELNFGCEQRIKSLLYPLSVSRIIINKLKPI